MLNKMMEQYKDMAELQVFADAQHKTIISQSKKIQELESEINHLKGLLSSTVPILHVDGPLNINDEESIARCQLTKLRDVSFARELTLEEARKLEIYSKIINQIESRPHKKAIPTEKLSNDQLIKTLNEPNE